MSVSARQNYHSESEAAINRQIHLMLRASYTYMAMSWYYDREDVALPGLHEYLKHLSDKKREQAETLMRYQNSRGGRIVLQQIKGPDRDIWGSALEAMQHVLDMEKHLNKTLLDLHATADQHNDPQMGDWIEEEFMNASVELIKKIADDVTSLRRVGPGLGEFIFDKEIKP